MSTLLLIEYGVVNGSTANCTRRLLLTVLLYQSLTIRLLLHI